MRIGKLIYTRRNILRGVFIYSIGDSIGALILGEFSVYRMLGMMLVGAPLEDRTLKSSTSVRHSTMSRVAWHVFPLVTLILIVVTFVLVITPMTVQK